MLLKNKNIKCSWKIKILINVVNLKTLIAPEKSETLIAPEK